jgi:hypothetical protein
MKDVKNILLVSLGVAVLFLYFYYSNRITEMKHTGNQLSDCTTNIQMENVFYNLNLNVGNRMTGLKVPDIMVFRSREDTTFLFILSCIPI